MVGLGLQVELKTMVMDTTVDDLPAMRAFAAGLGQGFRFDTNLHASLGGGTEPIAHRLSAEHIADIEENAPEGRDELKARAATAVATDRVYRCGAGRIAFNIGPDGCMQLCTLVRSLRFDLRRVPFAEAWEALGAETRRRYDSKDRRCSSCELQFMCGTCPGVAELDTGDPEAAVDEICETTHARATRLFGRPFVPAWKKNRPAKLRLVDQGGAHGRPSTTCGGGCGGAPEAAAL